MAKTAMINKQKKTPKFSTRRYIQDVLSAEDRTPFSENMVSAVFVSEN